MPHRSVHLPSLVALLVCSVACDVVEINHGKTLEARAQSLAEAYCAAYQACDCSPFPTDALHPDPDQCVEQEKARLVAAFEEAEEDHLVFDSSCMDQLLAKYEQLGCESLAGVNAEFGHPEWPSNFACALYHGDVSGGICELVPGTSWSDCEAGSSCSEDTNTCHGEITIGAQGDACGYNHVEFPFDCAMGLYCDQIEGCQPMLGLDEPCLAYGIDRIPCAVGHYCEPFVPDGMEGICRPLLDAGTPCASSQICDGRCEIPDGEMMGVCIDMPALCMNPSLQPPT